MPVPGVKASTLVTFAVPQESAFLRKVRSDLHIVHHGMGQENAKRALQAALATHRPDLIVTAGFAGGLNPALKTGALLFEFSGDHPLFQQIPNKAGARPGSFLCHDRVLVSVEEKSQYWRQSGKDAVEMESGHIQAAARLAKIPCMTLRVISDPADEPMPLDFNQLMTKDMTLSPWLLTKAIVQHPRCLPGLIRLGRSTKQAAQTLGQYLQELLPCEG